jgi:hypothetical protein
MRINIEVKTNAKENKIIAKDNNLFKIFVKQPAKEGKANKAIIELLANRFNISKSRINIKLGLKSKNKVIDIDL